MTLAHEYARIFRVWPMGLNKQPLAAGFDSAHPTATWDPDKLDPELPVGILCGPLQPGFADDWHVIGLDLDKAMTRPVLERLLGPLPPTLTSKGWRHAYYLIPADHGLYQRNAALTCEGGQLDIRPCAGGYLMEKGDWDDGFNPSRIALLPDLALQRLRDAIGTKAPAGETPQPAPAQISNQDWAIASALRSHWQPETTGDQAFGALGGWLAKRGVSRERARSIAAEIARETYSTHPDPIGRAEQAYDGECPLGRPALQAALSRDADEVDVLETLNHVEQLIADSVEGWKPPEPEKPSPWLTGDALAQPIAGVNWLVKELELAPGRCPIISADSGAGKSWAVQSLALAVASGEPVFGEFECRQGPVLHIAEDSDIDAVLDRYQRIARGMNLDLRKLPLHLYKPRFSLTTPRGDFDPKRLEPIREAIAAQNAVLVIVDSLASTCVGLDENSPEIAQPLYATRDREVTWLWTHHTNKGGESYRGSSALKAAAGAMWSISGKDAEARTWTCVKHAERTGSKERLAGFSTEWDGERVIAKRNEPENSPRERACDRAQLDMLRLLDTRKATKAELILAAGGTNGTRGQVNKAVFEFLANPLSAQIVQVEKGRYTLAPGVKVPAGAHLLTSKLPEDVVKGIVQSSNSNRRK